MAVKDFIDEKLTLEKWSLEQITGHCNKHKISMVSVLADLSIHSRQDKKDGRQITPPIKAST